MSDWKEILLGEYISIKNGYAFKSRDFIESGIPVLKIKNVKPNEIRLEKLSFVSEKIAEANSSFLIEKESILLTMSGNRYDGSPDSWVGKAALFREDGKFLLNQRVCSITSTHEDLNQKWLSYFLSSWEMQLYLIHRANSSGGQANISPTTLKEITLKKPPLPEQRAIASVLSSLDDKIDLLHRQNETLEKMAETLFRQWFVEKVDESWEVSSLNEVLTVKGGATPSTKNPTFWDGDIHWTSPRDITTLNAIYLFDTDRKITEAGLKKISSGLLPKGTLLMSSRAPVGVLAFAEVPIAINQGYIAIIDDKGFSKEFLFLWLKTNMDYVQSYANGSTFLEISKSAFKSLEIQIPPCELRGKFQEWIKPNFEKIKSNQTQIRSLTSLRDTLLPKLMSGEVRVNYE